MSVYVWYVCMSMRVLACLYVCMYVCSMYVYMYVCVCIATCVHTYMCSCLYVYMYLCTCMYVCMYVGGIVWGFICIYNAEARGWHHVSSLIGFHVIYWGRSLMWTRFCSLDNQPDLWTPCLRLPAGGWEADCCSTLPWREQPWSPHVLSKCFNPDAEPFS